MNPSIINKSLLGAVAAAALALIPAANAVPISGAISFAGGYAPDNPDLSAATTITYGTVIATGSTGDLAAIPAWAFGAVTFTAVPVPMVIPPPFGGNPLWTSVPGFSFDVLSQSVASAGVNYLTLEGSGILSGPGFDPTAATWIATFNAADGTFAFSASNEAVVPDGGFTLILMGLGLAGLGIYRRMAV